MANARHLSIIEMMRTPTVAADVFLYIRNWRLRAESEYIDSAAVESEAQPNSNGTHMLVS
jgi:hypothetical protein